MHNSGVKFEKLARAPKPLRPSTQPAGVHWTRTEAGQKELIRREGVKIAQSAIQGIGMSTKAIRGSWMHTPTRVRYDV